MNAFQFDRKDANITAWDSGCPDTSEHNSRDCAAFVSITLNREEERQLAARYRDLPCLLPVEDFQVAPICQKGGLGADTTTVTTTTTGTTTKTTTETTTERPQCPSGWATYARDGSVIKCFAYFGDKAYATSAEYYCQAEGGHLASIHSIEEQDFIIQTFNPPRGIWIGLVDDNHDKVFEWTDGSTFDFENWDSHGQPDGYEYYGMIGKGDEYNIRTGADNWTWRDWDYNHSLSYICQLTL